MLAVVRLHGDFELHLLEAVGDARLVVNEFDDVGMLTRDNFCHFEELAGLVGQLHGEAEDAAARDEGLADERRYGRDVDVAAREDGHDLLALEGQPCERREREDARALGDELVLLDEEEQGAHDLHLGDGDDVVEILAAEGEGQVARRLHGASVGDRLDRGQRRDVPSAEGGSHAGGAHRLDADDFDLGAHGFRCECHARGEAAAADGHEDGVYVLEFVDDFERRRSLPQEHVAVVERMDVDIALLRLQFERALVGVIEGVACKHDFSAVGARRLDLEERRRGGHTDDGFDAESLGSERDALRVVAGGRGDDALGAFLIRQMSDLVVGAAHLERAGVLKILGLQIDVVLAQCGKKGAVEELRFLRHAVQGACRLIYAGNGRFLQDGGNIVRR